MMVFDPPKIAVVAESEELRIHAFAGSERFLWTTSYILETKNRLIIIDGQLVVHYADLFRQYADSLSKPIDRAVLSHAHPDHYFGLSSSFSDIPVYALKETADEMSSTAEAIRSAQEKIFGDGVPKSIVIPQPQHFINESSWEFDGVILELLHVTDAEVEHQLVIKIPQLKTIVMQDLLYSNAHLCVERPQINNWISFLQGILTENIPDNYTLFLSGHGWPAGVPEVQQNIAYLQTATQLIQQPNITPEQYRQSLLKAYPDRLLVHIMDIYIPRLFAALSKTGVNY